MLARRITWRFQPPCRFTQRLLSTYPRPTRALHPTAAGYLTFNGPYAVRGRQLSFDVVRMNLGLGPLRFSIPLKSNAPASLAELPDAQRKALPFFLYAYVDDEMVVARGRSGGLALWLKTTSDFEAQAGLLQRYTQ